MKLPGPDHPIDIAPTSARVRVVLGGRTIADTTRALVLREAALPPVHYLPREDVDMAALRPSALRTGCPYKGEASYFGIEVDGRAVVVHAHAGAPAASIRRRSGALSVSSSQHASTPSRAASLLSTTSTWLLSLTRLLSQSADPSGPSLVICPSTSLARRRSRARGRLSLLTAALPWYVRQEATTSTVMTDFSPIVGLACTFRS